MGDYRSAIEDYRAAEEDSRQKYRALYNRGNAHRKVGELAESTECLQLVCARSQWLHTQRLG